MVTFHLRVNLPILLSHLVVSIKIVVLEFFYVALPSNQDMKSVILGTAKFGISFCTITVKYGLVCHDNSILHNDRDES